MTTNSLTVSVFVASPGDVAEERSQLEKLVRELNIGVANSKGIVLELIKWETHTWPDFGEDAQDVINQQLSIPDIFIGILWKRFGTPTKRAASGTQEEFDRVLAHWRVYRRPHILFYFSRRPYYANSLEELAQIEKVLNFRVRIREEGALIWEYDDPTSFVDTVRLHLINILLKNFDPAAGGVEVGDVTHFLKHIGQYRNLLADWKAAQGSPLPVSVVYVDLDNFGHFNAQSSISEGDRLLSTITGFLLKAAMHKARLYRVSGDEFVLLMSNHSSDEALATCERVRRGIALLSNGAVTASLGLACSEDTDPANLFWLAREAMTAAKLGGKDMTVSQPLSKKFRSLADRKLTDRLFS
jgi:diguanylate cyclase (GGDEF)-like protein